MKTNLENVVKSAIASLSYPETSISIVPTQDKSHGDYATSVAFLLSKELKQSPKEIAERLVESIKSMQDKNIKEVQVAGAGFINFFVADKALIDFLHAENDQAQVVSSFRGKKVMIEFTDPNPFKEFHIGHLYSNIVGESISRLVESMGAEVKRANYQGDVGLHVAKALWGIQQQIANGLWQMTDLEKKSPKEKAKFLGESYALGAGAYEEDPIAKEEIIQINKSVYKKDPEIMEIYTKGREWSLEYFESIYARLMSPKREKAFDRYYFESEAGPLGLEIVKENIVGLPAGRQVFKESDGAIVFPGEDHGLHTRVFINSLGLPTYEAKELGLAVTKYKDYPFDLSIMITGNEINEYFKVLLKALSLIHPEIAAKMKHLSHGMVRLPEGKVSSRTGNVVTGEWLLDEAVERVVKKMKSEEILPNDQRLKTSDQSIAEIVGVGAVKWALLKSSIGKDIEFSFDDSISFEGNSGPYIQYTYVRTQSVLSKSQVISPKSQDEKLLVESFKLELEERELLVALTRYNDVITEAGERFAPHIITTYLFELAQSFNNFYQRYPILKARADSSEEFDEDIKVFRLALTTKVGETIKNGLNVLGINTPERM